MYLKRRHVVNELLHLFVPVRGPGVRDVVSEAVQDQLHETVKVTLEDGLVEAQVLLLEYLEFIEIGKLFLFT